VAKPKLLSLCSDLCLLLEFSPCPGYCIRIDRHTYFYLYTCFLLQDPESLGVASQHTAQVNSSTSNFLL